MTLIGILMALIGALGALANLTGVYVMPGMAGDPKLWGGVAVIGAIVAMLTRRPRD